MARFLAAIQGSRGEATRLGTPSSGIRAQAQGWNVGVSIHGIAVGDSDIFMLYATGGSNSNQGRYIGRVILDNDVPTFEAAG